MDIPKDKNSKSKPIRRWKGSAERFEEQRKSRIKLAKAHKKLVIS
jgi:hypothetical protein